MALGASHSEVLEMVVVDGTKPILLGVAIGFTAALALGRVVSSLLHGVHATNPLTFAIVALLLVTIGLLATAVPVYRAARVEPTRTLREERSRILSFHLVGDFARVVPSRNPLLSITPCARWESAATSRQSRSGAWLQCRIHPIPGG